MRKIGIVLVAALLVVVMTTAVSPSQLAPAQEEFFNIYVTFWSGDLRIFALSDNTLVTIRDLDTGEILSLDDPRISDSPAPNFDSNPFILAEAGDAFEGVGGIGPIDQEMRVVIEATDATDPSIPKPILAWTGSLAQRLRHPQSTEPPTMGQNPWMSYIPGIPSSEEPVVLSRKLGREFLGFTSRELYLFAQKGDEDTAITIQDLETNTDSDTDDSQTLGPSDAILATDEIEIYYLDQFEDDTIRISSNVDVSALAGIASQVADDFTITPPSYGPEDQGFAKGTLFYTFVAMHLTVFPLEDDTTVTLTDLRTGEISRTFTLTHGDTTGPYNFYTPVLWTDDPDYGYMIPRESSPEVLIESNANEVAFDNDFMKVESDKPVLVYVGPVGSDVNEFADMQLAVPDSPTFRTVYTYAQDSGQSNDLQIFARSADTEVTITSLTYTEGFEAQGKEETWHDFTIGPGIGGANGWLKGTEDGGVWWGSDIWAGEILRIQSNLPVLVLGGDYDVPHFGAFTPYFAPNLPTITVVKEVKGVDDDATSFDFTFVDEDFALKNGESKLFDNLVAGTYTITETVPDNWLLTGITCDNGYEEANPEEPQVTVDLRWVEDVVCTFTNEPKAPTIKVVKEVKGIDDNTTSFDFTFVDEDFSLRNGESKLFEDLVAGTYTITETVPDNWLLTGIACDNGYEEANPDPPQVIVELDWADDIVCTFTNEIVTAVELKSFTAEADDDKVKLEWETASEIDNEGFNVWRSGSADGTYTQLNASLVPARGNADAGAKYEFIDTDVVQDTTYYYKLEDVDTQGSSTFHGPISATPTRIWRIFLPFVTGAITLPGAVIWKRKSQPS